MPELFRKTHILKLLYTIVNLSDLMLLCNFTKMTKLMQFSRFQIGKGVLKKLVYGHFVKPAFHQNIYKILRNQSDLSKMKVRLETSIAITLSLSLYRHKSRLQ